MRASNVPYGLTNQDQHRRLGVLYTRVIVQLLGPLATLALIDFTGKMRALIPFLALAPLLSLRFQLRIWRRYLRVFGTPPFDACRQMLRLDDLRGYDPLASEIKTDVAPGIVGGHRSAIGLVVTSTAGAGIAGVISLGTGLGSVLWVAALLAVTAVKALIRRMRPPAVVFLAASGPEATSLQLRIQSLVWPLVVVSCLHHRTESPLLNHLLLFNSFRAGCTWEETVLPLMRLSPIVVIDGRRLTASVRAEIQFALLSLERGRVYLVGPLPSSDAAPGIQPLSAGELLEALQARIAPN